MRVMAASEETRVRVERLVKMRGIVLVERALERDLGRDPDLMADLWDEALWTSLVSSGLVRSAMERRWRGAKGDVGGVEGEPALAEERKRVVVFWRVRWTAVVGRGRMRVAMIVVCWGGIGGEEGGG